MSQHLFGILRSIEFVKGADIGISEVSFIERLVGIVDCCFSSISRIVDSMACVDHLSFYVDDKEMGRHFYVCLPI